MNITMIVITVAVLFIALMTSENHYGLKEHSLYENKETGRIVEVVSIRHGYVTYRMFPDHSLYVMDIMMFIQKFKESK